MTTPDLTAVEQSSHFIRWNSIELLHNVVRTLRFLDEQGTPLPTVKYRAKIKLHGTNAAIQCTSNGPIPQSRSQTLLGSSDNCGFAKWVRANTDVLGLIHTNGSECTVFGEWCGPGVQNGMAISRLDRKIFAVFAIQDGVGEDAVLETCPTLIAKRIPAHADIFVIPWHEEIFTIPYAESMDAVVAQINQMVEAIEAEDPWVKSTFGISGLGEGMVLYPQLDAPLTPEVFSQLGFKAKGLKHRTVASKKSAQVTPEVAEGAPEFVAMQVTEARLLQGVSEACDGQLTMRNMGAFIRWICADVEKESVAELEASQLTWKQVSKRVSNRAREWYRSECEKC